MSEHTPDELPLQGQVLEHVYGLEHVHGLDGEYDGHHYREHVTNLAAANVITSRVEKHPTNPVIVKYRDPCADMHKPVLDMDLPVKLIPSSTPGHSHLYIDVELTWPAYAALLSALGDAGILEPGYVKASIERGYTAARLPWVRKQATQDGA